MGEAVFNKADHTYTLDGKLLISVTQLLKKHGLSPDYGNVDEAVLQRKAERGTLIHEEIERYIKNGESGFTAELDDFADMVKDLALTNMRSEVIVNNDIVAGTADLIAERVIDTGPGNDKLCKKVLIDFKTGTVVNKEAVRWQLSLYARLSGESIDEFYVFHLCEKSKYIPLERVADAEVDKLLECERTGELYHVPGLVAPSDLIAQIAAAERELKLAEKAQKSAKEVADKYRKQLYEIMEQQGISSWETLDKTLLVTRVAPTTKTTIDTERLRADLPEIADEYSKTSVVKGYVKITMRE